MTLTHRPLSPGSIRQVHAIIRGALGQAVKWEWVDRNVALLASPPKLRRQPVRPPTVATVLLLMAAAEEEDRDLGMAVRLAAATGARRGELCALRWSDVDLDAGVVRIARAVVEVRGKGTIAKSTKSYAERSVSLDDSTVEALKEFQLFQEERAAEYPLGRCDDPRSVTGDFWPNVRHDAFILSRSPFGWRPWTPSNLSATWAAHCKRHGAAGIRLHDLRHFSVTTLLDAGVPLHAVSARHGHSSASTTSDIYGHPVDGRDRQAANLMGRALNPAPLVSTDG